jgi:parvulin-like peptidyl-prolyl isomerase
MLHEYPRQTVFMVLSVLLCVTGSTLYGQDNKNPKDYPQGPPGVWAQVEDDLVTQAEVQKLHSDSQQKLPMAMALDSRILEYVLRSNVSKEGIKVSKDELDKAIEEAIYDAKRNNFDMRKRLKKMGITKVTFRRAVENQLLMKKRLAKEESDKGIENYFQSNRRRYVRQFRVARYLIKVKKKQKAKAERRAQAIIRTLENGGDWETLCRAGSEHPLASFDAGDLGWVIPGQARFDPIIEAARKLKLGDVTAKAIYTRGAYHIVKIMAERAPDMAFKDFRHPNRVRLDFRRQATRRIQLAWIKNTRIVRFSGAPGPSEIFPK